MIQGSILGSERRHGEEKEEETAVNKASARWRAAVGRSVSFNLPETERNRCQAIFEGKIIRIYKDRERVMG